MAPPFTCWGKPFNDWHGVYCDGASRLFTYLCSVGVWFECYCCRLSVSRHELKLAHCIGPFWATLFTYRLSKHSINWQHIDLFRRRPVSFASLPSPHMDRSGHTSTYRCWLWFNVHVDAGGRAVVG